MSSESAPVKGTSRKRLTKYEKARIMGERKAQIAQGAPTMLESTEGLTGIDEIVEEEFKQKLIPLVISRPMPNGTVEEYSLEDLM